MKAILEFELPEDNNSFYISAHAMDFALSLFKMDQKLREWAKCDNHGFTHINETLEKTREMLHEIMHDYKIDLDMIE